MIMPVSEQSAKIAHTVQIDRRKHAVITGVTDVSSFHETEIILKIENATMVIAGEDLHIGKLLLDDARLDVDGQIDSVIYEKPRAVSQWSFFRRLRKA